MKTILDNPIPESTRGILYLCEFNGVTIKVVSEILCEDAFTALQLYAEIPNPESQLVTGKTYKELCSNLDLLHKNMTDELWLNVLRESI